MSAPAPALVLRLATRGSALARAQAGLAAQALEAVGVATEPVIVRTTGDRRQDVPIARLEGEGWFTAELESALLDGRAEVGVHSAKDLPTQLAPGLQVAALLPRADPRDGVVTRDGRGLDALPPGSLVGTSSARRAALLGELHPQLTPVGMRGNVDTRLRKLDAGEVDALLLACAGLDRLGLGSRLSQRLDPEVFVPAPAQGAIALEVVSGGAAADAAGRVNHRETEVAVAAERALLSALGGGCLLPLGAWARVQEGRLALTAALGSDRGVRRARVDGDPDDPGLVARAAEQLR